MDTSIAQTWSVLEDDVEDADAEDLDADADAEDLDEGEDESVVVACF